MIFLQGEYELNDGYFFFSWIIFDLSWLTVVVQDTQSINLIFKGLYLTWCIKHILISKMC